MAGFSGSVLNVVLDMSGPFIKSKSEQEAEVRGRNRRRSCGGMHYEGFVTSKWCYGSEQPGETTSGIDVEFGEAPEMHAPDAADESAPPKLLGGPKPTEDAKA